MQLPDAILSPILKNEKKIILSQKKSFFMFWENGTLTFQEMELLSPTSKK